MPATHINVRRAAAVPLLIDTCEESISNEKRRNVCGDKTSGNPRYRVVRRVRNSSEKGSDSMAKTTEIVVGGCATDDNSKVLVERDDATCVV